MSFISYAQNFEDVMLWRALKHVQKGFYIDVGAWSPDIDSVTRLFYENNWRGINVEPNPEFHAQYGAKRPEDNNLKVAVGDREGVVLINFMTNPGLSTAVDQFAKQHESAGWSIDKQEVSLTTLASICKQHIKESQDIHFLKVDVEGLEEAALRGNDWSTYRPWIVLVEATLPMTQIESYQEWEPILINAGYVFAYADGLNRFYVAHEHAELLDSFKYPPNVFDSFLLNSQQEAEAKTQQAEAKAKQAEVKAQQAEVKAQQAVAKAKQAVAKAKQAEAKAKQAEAEALQSESHAQQSEAKAQQLDTAVHQIGAQLGAVYASKSWRVTAPLRWTYGQAKRLKNEGLTARLKAFVKKAIRKTNHELLLRPAFRAFLVGCASKLGLYSQLNALNQKAYGTYGVVHAVPEIEPLIVAVKSEGAQLSPRAQQIYADLKDAIAYQEEAGN